MTGILKQDFFDRDVLEVAPALVGKQLVTMINGERRKLLITETEAYRGEEDTACHASKGRTKRTDVMYRESGTIYVYLCYGMYWLINIVTGGVDNPQAVLIRACEGKYDGPGKLTRYLGITGELNGQKIFDNPNIFIEDIGKKVKVRTDKRVGISYASTKDKDRQWRFIMETQN